MLGICGFPESIIPTSSLKKNIYSKDFVQNVGLSALPIALYKRDDWRESFDEIFVEGGFLSIQRIQNYLESFIEKSSDLEDEDTLSKIQHSLALYSELTLFLNRKGLESGFNIFPKLWSHFCKQLIAQSDDSDLTLEYVLTMCPDLSESWITGFIKKFAIPYGSSNDVSERFSDYTLEFPSENDTFPEETTSETTADVSQEECVRPSDTKDKITNFPQDSSSELNLVPGTTDPLISSRQQHILEINAPVETIAHGGHTNGLTYVLQCLKQKKRTRSQKKEIEDAFSKINLDENISPENSRTKRRRKTPGKDAPK